MESQLIDKKELLKSIFSFMKILSLTQVFYIISSMFSILLITYVYIIFECKKKYTLYNVFSILLTIILAILPIVFIILLNHSKRIDLFEKNFDIFKKKLPINTLWISLLMLIYELIILFKLIASVKHTGRDSQSLRNITFYTSFFTIKLLFVFIEIIIISISYVLPLESFNQILVVSISLLIVNSIKKLLLLGALINECCFIYRYNSVTLEPTV